MDLSAIDEILRRISLHTGARRSLVLRGSRLTRALVAPHPRDCDDLDFLALFPWDEQRILSLIDEAVSDRIHAEVIYGDTDRPGLRTRHLVSGREVQIDTATGDPLAEPPVEIEILPGLSVLSASRETMIAWKLHGLYEAHDRPWRCKDLHDLSLLLDAPLDPEATQKAISIAFGSRQTPLRRLDRLLEGALGRSVGSQRTWRKFARKHPLREVPLDLEGVVSSIARRLSPIAAPLRALEPDPEPFPSDLTEREAAEAIASEQGYLYLRDPVRGLSLIAERSPQERPHPERASSFAERRRRLVLADCRGLLFDREGALIARVEHALPNAADISARPLRAQRLCAHPSCAARLGGSLVRFDRSGSVAPLALPEPWLRLCDAHAASSSILFEDLGDDARLVAIRSLRVGTYLGPEETRALAESSGVLPPLFSEPPPDLALPGEEILWLWAERGPVAEILGRTRAIRAGLQASRDPELFALQLLFERAPLEEALGGGISAWIGRVEQAIDSLTDQVSRLAERGRATLASDPSLPPALRRAVYRHLDGHPDPTRSVLRELCDRPGGREEIAALLSPIPPLPLSL